MPIAQSSRSVVNANELGVSMTMPMPAETSSCLTASRYFVPADQCSNVSVLACCSFTPRS